MHPKNISIQDYKYILPEDKIALFPLKQRDRSKLLIYKEGKISEDIYANIDKYIPPESLMVFNNTKVIRARIFFQKPTGGVIEICCLEPQEEISEYATVMNKRGSVRWKCLVGGISKWKSGTLSKTITINGAPVVLNAELKGALSDAYMIELSWQPRDISFADILLHSGEIPLPPYIKRKADDTDAQTYQTIYASVDGSVAAPTAGLHFTEEVLQSLSKKKITSAYVTLHVGAGTFKPVKAAFMQEHEMHAEWIDVSAETIRLLIASLYKEIIATGTTSLRTLESLYWMGVKSLLYPHLTDLSLSQWEVYEQALADTGITSEQALSGLLNWMERNHTQQLFSRTQLLIAPGYRFRIVQVLVTNFHQPESTLLLLVAAITGNDWKKIYEYALNNDFRFLSYGDGSILFL